MKKAIAYFVLGMVAAFAAGIAFLAFSPNYDVQVVRSESMKPSLQMGDVVVTGKGDIKPGRIISYRLNGELITHRVISVEGGNIQTKGDALEDPDPWQVGASDVEGVFLFKIPYLGFLSAFVRTPLGWAVLVIVPAVFLIGFFIRDILRRSY